MAILDGLTAAVAQETTVEGSLATFVNGLAANIQSLINNAANTNNQVDPVALQALVTQMTTNNAGISAAVLQGTGIASPGQVNPIVPVVPVVPVVPAGTLVITPVTLSAGSVGVPYGPVQLASTGGIAPVTFSATGLPIGLTLTPAGVLSGTVTSATLATIVVTATDSTTPSALVSLPVALPVTFS